MSCFVLGMPQFRRRWRRKKTDQAWEPSRFFSQGKESNVSVKDRDSVASKSHWLVRGPNHGPKARERGGREGGKREGQKTTSTNQTTTCEQVSLVMLTVLKKEREEERERNFGKRIGVASWAPPDRVSVELLSRRSTEHTRPNLRIRCSYDLRTQMAMYLVSPEPLILLS